MSLSCKYPALAITKLSARLGWLVLAAFIVFCFSQDAGAGPTNNPTAVAGWTNVAAGPGSGRVSVAVGVTGGSAWTAGSGVAWLQVAGGGTGSTNVVIGVAANGGGPRTGTVTVAGQPVTVTQAGAGAAGVNPVAALAGTAAGQPVGVAADGAGNV